jgi:hypothetical protein
MSCIHKLNMVVLPEAPPYVVFSLSHLCLNVGKSMSEAINEYMSCLTYRHKYALVLLWMEFQSSLETWLGSASRSNMSSASWMANKASRMPDQFPQSELLKMGRVMPAGMLKTLDLAVPSRVDTGFAAAFPEEVLGADAVAGGTAVGVMDCVDMFEMVSVTKEQ